MGADNSSLDNRSVTLRVPIDRGEKVMARLIPVVFNSCAGRLDIPKEKSPESLFNSFAVISVVRFFPLMYISLSFDVSVPMYPNSILSFYMLILGAEVDCPEKLNS